MLSISQLTGLGYQFGASAPTGAGSPTPWGPAQHVDVRRRDDVAILQVETAGHGGYYVPDALLSRIPDAGQAYAFAWSGSKNWYEEDCAWAYVALALPELFSDEAIVAARATVTWIDARRRD